LKNRLILKKYFYPAKILIAYSGGQDSSALLAIFYILSKNGTLILVSSIVINWTHSTKASSTAFDIIQNLNLPFYFVDSKEL
jgi:tRNA(Ile)-lysidine synthase TilS/MesJ